nr:type VI secretion system tip protein VgrG [Polyangiaceae bacterium]
MARPLSTRFAVGALEASAVLSFREEHELGRPPELSIVALFGRDIDPGELLGKPARLGYAAGGGPEQAFAGVVGEVEVVGQPRHDTPVFRYEFRIVTPLGLLAQNVETRIFQGQDVKAVVTAVLGAGGVSPSALRWRLSAAYAPYVYKVQYQESDLAFISRLLEREGIFFFVEPDADEGLAYVFADDGAAAEPIEGGELRWADLSALQGDDDAIEGASDEHRLAVASVALGDVDFERPDLDLSAHAAAGSDGPLEWYEHPGAYREPDEGKRLANVRLQALRGPSHRVAVEADAPRLRAGRKVTLVDGPAGLDGTYLVVAVEHTLAEAPEASGRRYRTRATLQPESLPFRTPQRTPRPIIDGPQTAVVVAPRGSPPESIHTDELGRCKVKFAWDTGPDLDDKAS